MTQEDRIYFNIHTASYNRERQTEDDIVYTRTDAFLDKAAIWFNNNLGHDECGVISYQFDTEEEMVKDFIEYMKGE